MKKISSVLDYQRDELDPLIWNNDTLQLRPSVKSFLVNSVIGFCEELELEGYEFFVKDILIGSSLATYFYTEDTDLDIKIVIDVDTFRRYNKDYASFNDDEILDQLLEYAKDSYWLRQVVPNTLHQLDPYFYSIDDIARLSLLQYDSLYSVSLSGWIREPRKLPSTIRSQDILDYAKTKAQRYLDNVVEDIEQVRRDSIDFIMLYDYIKSLPREEAKKLYDDLENSLRELENSIYRTYKSKEELKDYRRRGFSKRELLNDFEKNLQSFNYSDENLVFKLMQRYGYMRILSELSKLIKDDNKITPDEAFEAYEITSTR